MYKNRKKVLIRGAGDLATGVGVALHRAGFRVIMTEIAVPLTVRREVAMSRAVYEGRIEVEGIEFLWKIIRKPGGYWQRIRLP